MMSVSVAVLALTGCGKSKEPGPAAASRADSTASRPLAGAAPGAPNCPATGSWARCSVLYRLERSGIAPRLDSTETVDEKALTGEHFAVKFGTTSRLEIFLYPDSAARIADATKLDRSKLVNGTATQTMNRERTLIENANLIGLLTSLNERLRERVSDALTAGAPQPPTPPTVR